MSSPGSDASFESQPPGDARDGGEGAEGPLRAWIRGLPKAELHVHLEGSVPPALALELAARHGIELPGAEGGVAGLRAAYRFRSFRDFIGLYVAISSCLVDAADFELLVWGVGRELQTQGVHYAEMTFTPMTHVARGVDAAAMLDGLQRGRVAVESDLGVRIAFVFDIVRSFPDQGGPTVDLMCRARAGGLPVVAIGVGGPEGPQWPHQPLVPYFQRAKAEGFRSVPHAGEQDGATSVEVALDAFMADRIGHGVRSIESPALIERLVRDGIPLEVCPTSNLRLGIYETMEAHPFERLRAAGVRVSLASDDPPLFGTTLVDEYQSVAEHFGYGRRDLHALASAAVEHSFLPEDEKRALMRAQASFVASQGLD